MTWRCQSVRWKALSERRLFRSATQRSTIRLDIVLVSGLKRMTSSSLLRNSGRKCTRRSFITAVSASGRTCPLPSILPAGTGTYIEVRMMIVFLKSTVLPWESVISVIQDLEQYVEYIRVGFPPRQTVPLYGLRRLLSASALIISHISRRRTNQTCHGVLLHVLTHIDTHHVDSSSNNALPAPLPVPSYQYRWVLRTGRSRLMGL